MITSETALAIAYAYREIETAEKLLADVIEQIKQHGFPKDIRDAFGRHVDGLELGVPSSNTSRRLFRVPWALAKPVIEAHIANQKAILGALNAKAKNELEAG